jgi:hypothetical protein
VSKAADAGYGDDAAGPAAAERRRRPFFSGHDPGAAAAPATSFLDHVRIFLSSLFGEIFEARGLDRRPGAWHSVLDAHIDALTDVTNELHARLAANLVDESLLPVKLLSWETLLDGKMIDDTCVDRMAACVAAAAGSSMMGKQQGPGNVSECVKIDADRASGYCVMGI